VSTEHDSETPGINRRTFVRGAGVTIAGIAAVAVGAEALLGEAGNGASAQNPAPALDPAGLLKPNVPVDHVLEGDIISTGPRSLVIRPVDSAPVTVDVAPNANISKEGLVPLSSYGPGDEVVVLGDRHGNHFTAVGVAAVFRMKEVTLYSREGRDLHTSDGRIVLTPNTEARGGVWAGAPAQRRPLADLKAGDELVVSGLVNQNTGVMTANSIGVRAAGGGNRRQGP
jgi:hypothetical protein